MKTVQILIGIVLCAELWSFIEHWRNDWEMHSLGKFALIVNLLIVAEIIMWMEVK